jgi:hypothetical protein
VLLPTRGWPAGTRVVRAPDWAWRFDLVEDTRPDSGENDPRPPSARPRALSRDIDPSNPLEGYVRTLQRHAAAVEFVGPRRIVFTANVGLVGFVESGGQLNLRHDLFTVHPRSLEPVAAAAHTSHVVPLVLTTDAPPTIGGVA